MRVPEPPALAAEPPVVRRLDERVVVLSQSISIKLDALLDDPHRLARMRAAVKRLARPTAPADIISIVTRQEPGGSDELHQ